MGIEKLLLFVVYAVKTYIGRLLFVVIFIIAKKVFKMNILYKIHKLSFD